MKEARILLDDHGIPVHLTVDGAAPVPISAFVLLTSVPSEPVSGHILAFGNSDTVGRLLYNFWERSVIIDPGGAMMIEMVCRDIIAKADSARKPWPGDGGGVSH